MSYSGLVHFSSPWEVSTSAWHTFSYLVQLVRCVCISTAADKCTEVWYTRATSQRAETLSYEHTNVLLVFRGPGPSLGTQ